MFPFFLALYNGSQVSVVALWATCLLLGMQPVIRILKELCVYDELLMTSSNLVSHQATTPILLRPLQTPILLSKTRVNKGAQYFSFCTKLRFWVLACGHSICNTHNLCFFSKNKKNTTIFRLNFVICTVYCKGVCINVKT